VPTWNVDTRKNGNNGWCPMRYAGSVQRVYDLGAADPTEPVDPTTWSYSSVTRNGKVFTVIYKTSGKFIGPVTADIEGVLDGADLITNPARQLEHALSNLAWDGAAPLDPTWLDLVADLFDDLGLRGSFRAYQRESGIDLFDRWLAQWPFLRAVWGFSTGDALIEIFPLDWRTWSTPATWLRYWHRDDGSLMRISYDREQLSEIKVHYLANAAADAQLRTLVCANPDAPFGAAARGLESGLPATFG
jgi:hypothetical protein